MKATAALNSGMERSQRARRKFVLLVELTKRDVLGRYRGSSLGIFWSVATPLLMLAVFTFVFGTVFRVKWAPESNLPHSELALILFAGLAVFNFFAESVSRSPSIVVQNSNFVKKVVFPLELLPLVVVTTALFHCVVTFVILLIGKFLISGFVPATALLLPIVLFPVVLFVTSLSWALAALGVYVRDIGHTIGLVVTALMFLSPVFYPLSALPPQASRFIALNPLATPIENVRQVLLFGKQPDWSSFLLSVAIGMVALAIGYTIFAKTRKGFADVI